MESILHTTRHSLLPVALVCCFTVTLAAETHSTADVADASPHAASEAHLDRTGKVRKGKASYYGKKFYSRKMADGSRMDPQSNAAASKTLPLGTKAKVTNLENGNSATVAKDCG
jgi:rare lipoprotein A